jgi:hypothetical protein
MKGGELMNPVHKKDGPGMSGKRPPRSLAEQAKTVWLDSETARFFVKNGLLWIEQNGEACRVKLCRQFPFDLPWEYISVLDEHDAELGILRRVDLFDAETEQILRGELERRYYAPKLISIRSVKEKYGFSYWKATTDEGEISFVLQDTHRSILRVNDERIFFSDVDGNRYEIPALSRLDEKSRRRLELYL